MSPALRFQQVFRDVLAQQVEYSYDGTPDRVTTMIPLKMHRLREAIAVAGEIPFAGDWAWAMPRFAAAVEPDELLFRLDWERGEVAGVTLYGRFRSEPDAGAFRQAVAAARPFGWTGPDTAAVAAALGVAGPRGVAFRATRGGGRRTAAYFRSDEAAGPSWASRLPALLAACTFPEDLAPAIERDLRGLYHPGAVGVIGVDEGHDGAAGSVKFDPAGVPLGAALTFLEQAGVPAAQLDLLRRVSVGLRADAAT